MRTPGGGIRRELVPHASRPLLLAAGATTAGATTAGATARLAGAAAAFACPPLGFSQRISL